MTYWIAIGVFVTFVNGGTDVSKTEQVRMEVYPDEVTCNEAVIPIRIKMDQFIEEGKLAGYVLECKAVDVADPKLNIGTAKKNENKHVK